MERKCDTVQQRGDVGWRRGSTREGKGVDDTSWADANLTRLKNEENSRSSIQSLQMDGEDLKQR
jgi:hypothetical protein